MIIASEKGRNKNNKKPSNGNNRECPKAQSHPMTVLVLKFFQSPLNAQLEKKDSAAQQAYHMITRKKIAIEMIKRANNKHYRCF